MAQKYKKLSDRTLLKGVRYLAAIDQDLNKIVVTYGPPPLWEREQGFHTLIRIILEQQVSLASAKAAYDRLEVATRPLTPESFLELNDVELKRIGFSRQKTKYGRHLAEMILEKQLDLENLNSFEEEAVKDKLMKVKGIGRWTSEIYLLMALGRPDIWPTGDLALAVAVQKLKGLKTRPTFDELQLMSESWQPWRAVAARLLWHFYLSERK
jgi:DNA-3-methyladenine glycosylase II